ncbi:hypothetical protein QC761_0061970 [Podospora bellae-mahoneyi]|uniref:HEAT repeat domain-containing protein n=1 Tax=Podospora bellae-mahoneyi TaxID=2093777 RepID=A0ABR0FFX2_9PEZI|nr:hypothetical protein QC761_0061970 [Podospora bellae-mahoneyi]
MHVAHRSEISKSVKLERWLLEFLAFTGMHNDVMDFEQNHRDAISENFKLCETDFLLDEILGSVSFLRTSDISLDKRDRNYHFIHLTFQEYFAARYFVRQWKEKQPLKCLALRGGKSTESKPATFLEKHKYDTRYDIFWRFVAGLIDAGEMALDFFQMIEKEPRDILGPTHQRLIMHCLSEVERKESKFIELRAKLEKQLEKWVLFECNLMKSSRLCREMECPENVLLHVLTQASEGEKTVLFESLSGRTTVPFGIIKVVSPWLTNRTSALQYKAILRLLRNYHNNLPDEILENIAARLEDKDQGVREAAIRALGGRADLPDQVLQVIVARLEHKDGGVRSAVIRALGGRADLPDQVLQVIAARLEDKDRDVRLAAIEALLCQPALSSDVLSPYIRSFSEALLQTSFVKHLYWYASDSGIIGTSLGHVSLTGKQHNLMEAVRNLLLEKVAANVKDGHIRLGPANRSLNRPPFHAPSRLPLLRYPKGQCVHPLYQQPRPQPHRRT